jgi:cytochrome c551
VSRRTRLVVIPALLVAGVAGGVYALAELHPAKPEAASPAQAAGGGGAAPRGSELFAENCSGCHGAGGAGGGIGPTLAGSGISADDARVVIENGRGSMPGGLVEGEELEAVVDYIELIAAG